MKEELRSSSFIVHRSSFPMIGGLIIDKPEGWTSHDVVGRVRRLAGTRRVGHTGTLDPFATGVLVVCLGAATRLSRFLTGCDKEYLATMRLGWATDTQDLTGERVGPLAPSEEIPDDAALIRRVLDESSGEQDQLPPMYSAKKVGGETLYKLARKGREVSRATARIRATLELLGPERGRLPRNADGTVDLRVRVVCSAGTYVRTLAHDLGARLGCGGHLAALRRTRVGLFTIDAASTLEEIEGRVAECLVPPERLIAHLPRVVAQQRDAEGVLHGRAVPLAEAAVANGAECAIVDPTGRLIAVGAADAGLVRPRVVLG
jgi:tRNA pseudouridine55 synthase